MTTTILFFLCWAIYLTIGLIWINWVISNNLVKEPNVIGSLVMITLWPILLPFFRKKK